MMRNRNKRDPLADARMNRRESFLNNMIRVSTPQSAPFMNAVMEGFKLTENQAKKVLNQYGDIAYPSYGSISPLRDEHRSRDLALLIDLTLGEVAGTEKDRRAEIYEACVPKSAKALLKINGIENDVVEGAVSSSY